MQIIWKEILGYEGLYEVSNTGIVKSLDRYDTLGRFHKGVLISTKYNNRGYVQLHLHKDGQCKMVLLHRVVAEAFIDNPNKYKQINHKDENKDNNNVENLEWCTNLYNRRYGTGYKRSVDNHNYKLIGKKNSKAIKQYNKNGDLVNIFYGVKEAERRTGINESNIRGSIRKNHLAGGYKWEYV